MSRPLTYSVNIFFSGGGIFFLSSVSGFLKMLWTSVVNVSGQFLACPVTEILQLLSPTLLKDYTSMVSLYSTSFLLTLTLWHLFKICRFCSNKKEARCQKVGEGITRKKGEPGSNLIGVGKHREEQLSFPPLRRAQGFWQQGKWSRTFLLDVPYSEF